MSFLDFFKGEFRTNEWYEEQAALLQRTPEEYHVEQHKVLEQTIANALALPMFADQIEILQEITVLDDLTEMDFYMGPKEVLPTTSSEETWKVMLGDQKVLFSSKTSGSSGGLPNFMPYTDKSLLHSSLGLAPFVANEMLKLRVEGIKKPVMLALTGAKQFITYDGIHPASNYVGFDVTRVPLPTIMGNNDATQELIKYLNENDVHVIGSVATMIIPLIGKLYQFPGGPDAIRRLSETLKCGIYGGTPIGIDLEDSLKERFPQASVINAHASTEYLISAASDGINPAQVMHINPNYCIAGIIPVNELEIESKNNDYIPKMTLLDTAAIGTEGELVITMPAGISWINARTSDKITIVQGVGYTSPAFVFSGRVTDDFDLAGGKIYSSDLKRGLEAATQNDEWYIKDTLFQLIPAEQLLDDDVPRLEVYVDGNVLLDHVKDSLLENSSHLHAIIVEYSSTEAAMARMAIYRVPSIEDPQAPGIIQQQRLQLMEELRGAHGVLKHKFVTGYIYKNIPYTEQLLINFPA